MIHRPSFVLASALTSLLLCSCSTGGGYPSLARRPFETAVPVSPPPTVPENIIAPDADLPTRIESLRSQAQAGMAAFDALYGQAAERVRVGAAAPVGSENWVVAEVAVARLEQECSPAMVALASLDSLYAERMKAVAAGDAAPAEVTAIEAARAPVLAAVETQNARIDTLKAMLTAP